MQNQCQSADTRAISAKVFAPEWLRISLFVRLNSRRVFLASLLILCCLGTAAASPAPLNGMQIELYRRGIAMRTEADQKLLSQMEDIADWLVQFNQRYGHFPEPGTEQDEALQYLQRKVLKSNPYIDPYPYKDDLSKIPLPKIKFVLDARLTAKKREEWEKKPPETWSEEAGTITIMTNGEKCLLIWGSTADKSPIADYKAKNYPFAWREFN